MTAFDPQPVRNDPLPQRLDAQAQPLTRSKRGIEIGIVLLDQCQNGASECLAMSAIARPTTLAGNQDQRAIHTKGTRGAVDENAQVSAVLGVPGYAPCPRQGICITYSLLLLCRSAICA
jgi:hypothetical protein